MAKNKRGTVQYNYDLESGEFVENYSGYESGNLTGNRVFITNEGDDQIRYNIEIDAFGDVVGALNRLIQRLSPTFIFPKTRKHRA